ncbi:hypothetical protein GQX74_006003 [Glossina fuscipes]|nr:hypothetical protein GQX74_006003 [Glossina fuscipes]
MFGLKSSTGSGPNSSYGYSQYQFGESKRRNKMFLTKGLSKLKPSNQYSQVLPGIRKLKNFPENGTQIKDQPSAATNFKPPPFDSENTQPLMVEMVEWAVMAHEKRKGKRVKEMTSNTGFNALFCAIIWFGGAGAGKWLMLFLVDVTAAKDPFEANDDKAEGQLVDAEDDADDLILLNFCIKCVAVPLILHALHRLKET